MAIRQTIGAAAGVGAGEVVARLEESDRVDRGTLATGVGGVAVGTFAPIAVNAAAGRAVYDRRAAGTLAAIGVGMGAWTAARLAGVAPRIDVRPPESVNLADAIITATLTGIATAGIVTLLPQADRVL